MNFLKKINLRIVSQIVVLILILWLAFTHQKFGIEKAAPVDAYCPLGAVETFFTSLFEGKLLTRIYYSNFILLGIFIIMTIFLWRVFCGFFCPLGAIQEWLRNLGKKIWIKKDYEFPKIIDKYLRYLKYLVLFGIIYFSYIYTDLVFRLYDPFVAFSHLGNEVDEIMYAYVILAIILVWSLFTRSFFCRYTCPLGAVFGTFKKFSFFKLEKDAKTCTKCWACSKSCPIWLDFKNMKEVNSAECISCMKCISSCKFNSLKIKVGNKEVSKNNFIKITVLGFFATLLIIIFTPIWKTMPVSNLVWADGKINVEDLRGSNTLEFTIKATKVPFEYFQTELSLPANIDKSSKIKHIWEDYNIKNPETWEFIETEEFRETIEKYYKEKK